MWVKYYVTDRRMTACVADCVMG